MLGALTHDDFAHRVGETFAVVAAGDVRRTFALVRADPSAGPADGGRTPFSLLFADASSDRLEQQTVAMRHPDLGEFPLFVVPVGFGPQGEGIRYEAVFT